VLERNFPLLPQRVAKLEEDSIGLLDKVDIVISDTKPLSGRLVSLNDAVQRLETDA